MRKIEGKRFLQRSHSFKGEIVRSKTFIKLQKYNNKRSGRKEIVLPSLETINGEKEEIFNNSFNKHIVIFWASWCLPCIEEIPLIENKYKKYGEEIQFVSISIDENRNEWLKALKKGNMKWKQMIVGGNVEDYEALQIYFKFNKSIPYTVLLDKDHKIIKTYTGLMDEDEIEEFIKK